MWSHHLSKMVGHQLNHFKQALIDKGHFVV